MARRSHPGLWTLILLAAGCSREKPYEKPLTPVTVRAVETFAGGSGQRFSGNIGPYSRVDLAFKVGGYVETILMLRGADGRQRDLQEGDQVAKGTVLARVRESDYVAKVSQAKAQLAQAEAAVEQARSQLQETRVAEEQARLDFDRAKNLFATQSLTKADYDGVKAKRKTTQAKVGEAQAALQVAEARVEGARAQLHEAEIALGDCALKAPMDAVVLKRLIEVGSLVGAGAGGFSLADTSSVKVQFGVPDVQLPSVKLGQSITILTEAIPGADFAGRVTQISPAADAKTRVFDTEITIPNPGGRLKVGMVASLEVPGAKLRAPAPVVPLTAIVRSKDRPDGYAVFVVEEQGGKTVPHAREVKLGETFGSRIGVSQGLKPGERVVVTGASMVRDGEAVEVVP